MESWHPLALPSVYEAYLEQPTPEAAQPASSAMPTGELFHLALLHYSERRHTMASVAGTPEAPHVPQLVTAESGSILSIVYGFLRGRRPRA